MIRTFALAAVTLGAVTVTFAQAPPGFRTGTDTVRVYATVARDNRLVTNLTRDDFEIRDGGRRQPVTVFDNRPVPIRIVILVDVSGSMRDNLPFLQVALPELVTRLYKGDVARLGHFAQQIVIQPSFTRDPAELVAGLPQTIVENAPTPLWSAVSAAFDVFDRDESSDARQVVLIVSDGGFVNNSEPQYLNGQRSDAPPLDPAIVPVSFDALLARARGTDIMIYSIRVSGGRFEQPFSVGGLQRLADETGGGYIEVRNGPGFVAAFTQVITELHGQYTLGFEPATRDGKVHDIEVRVPGMKVYARKSFVAPKQ